jgi:hypothetical protein
MAMSGAERQARYRAKQEALAKEAKLAAAMKRIAVKGWMGIHEGDTLDTRHPGGVTTGASVSYHLKDVVAYYKQTHAAWVEARRALVDKLWQARLRLFKSDKELIAWLANNDIDLSAADVKRLLREEPVT